VHHRGTRSPNQRIGQRDQEVGRARVPASSRARAGSRRFISFDENNAAQTRALALIAWKFAGAGTLARKALAVVPGITAATRQIDVTTVLDL